MTLCELAGAGRRTIPLIKKATPALGKTSGDKGERSQFLFLNIFVVCFIDSAEKNSSSSSSTSSTRSSSSGSSSSSQWSLLLGSMITWVEVLTYPVVIIT